MRRYLPPVVALAVTFTAVVMTLTTDVIGTVGGLYAFLIVGAGAGTTLLLFLLAFVGRDERPVWPSLALGGLVIPFVVIIAGLVLFYPLLALADVVVEWIESSSFDLGRTIEPWALALIVELAVLPPLVEEFLKPFGSILRRPKTRRDAFMFGAAA